MDNKYTPWGAEDMEDYMHKPNGVKGTSIETLQYLHDHVDEINAISLDQFINWVSGKPGANWASPDSVKALRLFFPNLPLPREEDSQDIP
jgi:hypothetical protein